MYYFLKGKDKKEPVMLCFLLQFLKQPTQENFSDRKKT